MRTVLEKWKPKRGGDPIKDTDLESQKSGPVYVMTDPVRKMGHHGKQKGLATWHTPAQLAHFF